MSKFCVHCGNEINENSTTCEKCGSPIYKTDNPNPTIVNQTVINNNQKKSNGVAVAGFIVSLVSILCCGGTSIIGLILSIVGLVSSKKLNGEGKGLSIAGIIISSIFVLLSIAAFTLGIIGAVTETMYY